MLNKGYALERPGIFSENCNLGAQMAKKLLLLDSGGRFVVKGTDGAVKHLPVGHQFGPPPPHFAFLLLDCSDSMHGQGIQAAKDGAISFTSDAVRDGYSLGLVRFASEATLLCKLGSSLEEIRGKIDALEADGSTNMTDAIVMATREMPGGLGPRAIVIATDGNPNDRESALEAASAAKQREIDIIVIGAGSVDAQFISDLASRADLAIMVAKSNLALGISGAVKLLPAPGHRR